MTGRRLHLVPVALAPAILLLVAACADDTGANGCDAAEIPYHDDETLVIEGDAWSGYAPFRDPDHLLANTGLSAFYIDQPCQAARAEDLTTGRADIALTTLDQYILHEPEGTVVGVIDQSLGADALVLNTRQFDWLDSIDDLPFLIDQSPTRPVIAYTGNSPSEMLLNELSNTYEELRLDDFELKAVDQSVTAFHMLDNEEAQLAVLWEPDTSAAVASGYTVALSSKDVPDSIVDVIVASDRLIHEDPTVVPKLVQAFYDEMDDYLAESDLGGLTNLYAQDGHLADDDARKVIDGIKLYGTQDASAFLNDDEFPLDRPQIQQSIESIGSLLALIHPGVDPDNTRVDGHYVKELLG